MGNKATDGLGSILSQDVTASTVQVIRATPGSDGSHPISIGPATRLAILVNQTGGQAVYHLPDAATDGVTVELVSGAPGSAYQSNAFIYVLCSNGWGNDGIDLNVNNSCRLTWVGETGGWVMTSCNNLNFWD